MINSDKYPFKTLLWSLLMLFVCIHTPAQANRDNLKTGKLANGLSYYVLDNKNNPGVVNFYLLQNVGAIVEKDNENGMAHYLEHMAFNTTRHFPDGVMNFLRNNGIYTFNAHTGVNETVYQITNIPTANTALSDTCLLILSDWCNGISLKPEDVEKERGIIIEEWRTNRNIERRIQETIAPAIYNDSKYAKRNIIGDVNVLRSFRADNILGFYQQWYRPDLQSIIVIGDINPSLYEKKIKEIFSSIPSAPSNAPKRENIVIETNTTPRYIHFADKDNTSNSFGLYQRIPYTKLIDNETEGNVKLNIYLQLFNTLVSQRFGRIRNDNKEHFIAATVALAPLTRRYYSCDWDMVPYENREKEALNQMLTVREQIRREGFTSEEFLQLRQEQNQSIKELLNEEYLGVPDNFVSLFREHFLYGTPIVSLREQLQEQQNFLLEMEVEDLNNWVKSWMGDNENISFITYTTSTETPLLTSGDFNGELHKISSHKLPIEQKRKEVLGNSLIDFPIKEGKVVKTARIEELDMEKWTLSNGASVLYKHLPNEKRVFFVAASMGGESVVKTEDLPSFRAMKELIMRGGLYKYNRNDLYEIIRSKDFEVNLTINDYTEVIGGNAALNDAESMFKYAHLIFTKPIFTKEEFQKYVQRKKYLYQSANISEMTKVQNAISALLYPPTARNRIEDIGFYNDMKFERILPLYNDRFGNAADFTFCIVGGLHANEAKNLVQRYLASLPAVDTPKEKYKEVDFASKERRIVKEFTADIPDDIGTIEISYFNPQELTQKEQLALSVFGQALRERLFEVMREQENATYNVDVHTDYRKVPSHQASIAVRFETHREKADYLKEIFYKELNKIIKNGISENEFKKITLPILVNYKMGENDDFDKEISDPTFWLQLINIYVENDGKINTHEYMPEQQVAEILTREDVESMAKKMFDNNVFHRDIVVKSIAPEVKEWVH